VKVSYFTSFIAALILLVSCGQSNRSSQTSKWMEESGKVKTLSTTEMIGNLVDEIGGQYVDNIVLIKGDLDPHSYQLVKGDDEKIYFADLIFFNGLGLEHGPSLQRHLLNNPKAIALGNRVQSAFPDRILYFQKQLDPHIWMDISMWSETIPFIVEALSQKDPAHADYFHKNGSNLQKEMEQAHAEVKSLLHQIPAEKRYLVTSHDAFNYFTKSYLAEENEIGNDTWQKRFAAPEGLAPDSQLSSTDIQNIIDHLEKYKVHVIFPESNVSKDSIKKIVNAGKVKGLNVQISSTFLYADAMGSPGSDGGTYLKMIKHNANTIAQELNR